MIPTYLQGKSAAQIIGALNIQHFAESKPGASQEDVHSYALKLETLLLIAVKDALCAADDKLETSDTARAAGAEGRAIAFLNMVVPAS